MPAAITADALLARVKARAQIPSTEGRLTDAEILALIDDLIVSKLGLAVYDADDGRWVVTADDVALTANLATYRVPSRAWAGGVDEVLVIDSAGNPAQLDHVDRSEVWEWGTATGVPCAFALMGDVIRLLPTPSSSSYSLRVRYVRRPNTLALLTDCGAITSATSATVVVSSVPSGWGASETVDIIRGTHHADSLEDDVATTISSTTLTRASGTFDTSGAYAPASGDYACTAGTSCVVQVPEVAIPYLVEVAARDVCLAIMDDAGADRRAATAAEARRDVDQMIAERSRQRPKIVPRNSPLRVSQRRVDRWRR